MSAAMLGSLDLSGVRFLWNGAEKVRVRTTGLIDKVLSPYGLSQSANTPGWGQAETTLGVCITVNGDIRVVDSCVSMGVTPAYDSRTKATALGPDDVDVRVVDPDTAQEQPRLSSGELWVRGQEVTKGYWRNEKATRANFGAVPKLLPGSRRPCAELPGGHQGWVRTGDLGFVDEDGFVFIQGRKKDVIIIRGRNIFPDDLEDAVSVVDPSVIRPGRAVAFSVDDGTAEELHMVLEARSVKGKKPDQDTLQRVAQAVSATVQACCGVVPSSVTFVPQHKVLLTSSGKLRRDATKIALLSNGIAVLFKLTASQSSPDGMGRPDEHMVALSQGLEAFKKELLASNAREQADGSILVPAGALARLVREGKVPISELSALGMDSLDLAMLARSGGLSLLELKTCQEAEDSRTLRERKAALEETLADNRVVAFVMATALFSIVVWHLQECVSAGQGEPCMPLQAANVWTRYIGKMMCLLSLPCSFLLSGYRMQGRKSELRTLVPIAGLSLVMWVVHLATRPASYPASIMVGYSWYLLVLIAARLFHAIHQRLFPVAHTSLSHRLLVWFLSTVVGLTAFVLWDGTVA